MANNRRKKKNKKNTAAISTDSAELNIMPFIDVFSVLNTFLLMSAVFMSVGIIKVQVPYFTSKSEPQKPKRSLAVNVDVEKDKLTLDAQYSMPPVNPIKEVFAMNETGYAGLHKKLVELRTTEPTTDLVTVFSDDEVLYEDLAKILDAIKHRLKGDPVFPGTGEEEEGKDGNKSFVYPKVVMGSVVL
jgi:biopolymer transport protein TolR